MEKRVLIIGYYGMGNVGSKMRLRVLVRDIRKVEKNADITIAAFKYDSIEKIKGVKYLYLKNPFTAVFGIITKISKFDYVICGEGIPFVDFCGPGFLYYFLPALYFANVFGKKTSCYSFDIDHLTKFHNWLTLKVLKKVDMLLVRTKKSEDFLKKNGVTNVHLGTDTSLNFNIKRKRTKRKIIGFCLKDFYCYPIKLRLFGKKQNYYHYPWYYTYAKGGKRKYDEFVQKIAVIIKILLEEDKKLWIQLIVLEHQMDYKIAKDVYKSIKNKKRIEIISNKNYSLGKIKSTFSSLKSLIATRYHASLMSLEYGVPTLILSSDERFNYLVEELGLEKFLINIYEDDYLDMKKVLEFLKKQDSIKSVFSNRIKKIYPILKKRAKNNYKSLKNFFED